MAGRTLQRAYGQRPQIAVCMPILVGTDGWRMSKSRGNHIALNDPPAEMYGKVMKLPGDDMVIDYFTLVTNVPAEEIEEIRRQVAAGGVEAMNVKKRLAREIVSELHGAEAARQAEEHFTQTFQVRKVEVGGSTTSTGSLSATLNVPMERVERLGLLKTLLVAGIIPSKSEGRRLLQQGAIDVDGQPITSFEVELRVGTVIRVGKHQFLRIVDADK
jgi:tyrosyl-tRNA synthetase